MKRFSKLVMLLLIALLFVACSNDGDSGKKSDKDLGDDEEITINYYNWDNDSMAKSTEKYIERFEKENPGIKVESKPLVPGDSLATMENLDVLLASGEPVDLIKFPSFGEVYERATKGALLPLNELYEDEGVDPEEEYFVSSKVDDDYYSVQIESGYNFVLLNKDALDEAGLDIPKAGWTWDDFADYADKLTIEKDGKTRYGSYFHTWALYMNPPAQTLMQHPFLFEDGTTNFRDSSWKYFYEYRKELEDKGHAKPYVDVLGADLSYISEFFNEETAMLLTGTFMVPTVGDVEENPHDFQTAFAPVPVINEGDPTEYFMGGSSIGIGKTSEHQEAAYKFARFVSTDMSDARDELPGLQNEDVTPLIERIIEGNEEYYDIESLMYVLNGEDTDYLEASQIVIDYGSELEEILEDGFAKYMLNNEDLDEVIDWMIEKADAVVEKHEK